MRILHTADWHLGDRLGRIDRTLDLRLAVERVARICEERAVDVLLIAGDLFSELSRPDALRASIEHLQRTFEGFLLRGGTIVAITGNHDNETFCRTLHLVMTLAAPAAGHADDVRSTGRLYLATEPSLLRLADRAGTVVQFLLLPYPTPARYFRGDEAQPYGSLEEKNRQLQAACIKRWRELRADRCYDPSLPAVMAAHIHVQGAVLPSLFRISEQESMVFHEADLPADLAYIALGHIHQAQCIKGQPHIRYSSSIERLDLGERNDQKGVVLVDIGSQGRRGDPEFIPLPATSIYLVTVRQPRDDLPRLAQEYPDAQNDLVKLDITYTAGQDNLEEILRELDRIFPRWYERSWTETGQLGPSLASSDGLVGRSFQETVRDYLTQELQNHAQAEREAVLKLAEELLAEEEE